MNGLAPWLMVGASWAGLVGQVVVFLIFLPSRLSASDPNTKLVWQTLAEIKKDVIEHEAKDEARFSAQSKEFEGRLERAESRILADAQKDRHELRRNDQAIVVEISDLKNEVGGMRDDIKDLTAGLAAVRSVQGLGENGTSRPRRPRRTQVEG